MRLVVFATLAISTAAAGAQPAGRRYAEEPTGGLALPTTPLAGEHDARAVSYNPGGLGLLRGSELALGLELENPDVATGAGPGFGTYFAAVGGGRFLPRLAVGAGFEWLRPARAQLDPDPGAPFRFTLATAFALGKRAGFGASWHHFVADGALAGVDAFDLGLSTRWGNHLALGAVLRDVATPAIDRRPVQRRYELEAVVRPLATDALEVAAGGRVGETRGDFAGWGRLSVRAARGVYLLAAIEARELHVLDTTGTGVVETTGRDVRATLGVELSFGKLGVVALGSGLRDERGGRHALGGTLVVRASAQGPASVLGTPRHIERVELAGDIGTRELTALVVRMRAIANDPTAVAVVVVFDSPSAGWATMQELRGELVRLRGAGKRVFAYLVTGATRDYFIASAADKIYVDPAGVLRIVGIAGTTIYFRGLFDLLGVVPQFEKIAEYKSAPEQFTERGPTPIAAKMHDALVDSWWREWIAAVAAGRKLTPDAVVAIVDRGPYTAGELAAAPTIVDAVATPEKIGELITKELGGVYPVDVPAVDRPERWQRPGIAIIYIDGEIGDGKSKSIPLLDQRIVGGETVINALIAARADPRVAGIVLRINSPGGSALASELIAREVFATRGVKPIVCSMSDLAASGGYFVAAGCETIFAEPMTITGSIGIFSGKFDVSGLAQKLGIVTDTYKRGARADAETMFRPYTSEERAVLAEKLRYMYSRFVGAVAEGRKLTKERVDELGRGHVYSGADALPLQLVDRFGGIGDAIALVKHRVGLADSTRVQLVELPDPPPSILGALGNLLGVRADEQGGAQSVADLPGVRELLRAIPRAALLSRDGVYARLPYDVVY